MAIKSTIYKLWYIHIIWINIIRDELHNLYIVLLMAILVVFQFGAITNRAAIYVL